ncbi:MAG: PP2C family protein-serine/threonine phosphatase [Pirellula sp.]|jgi:serine/threonine protein phosphatase PrpC
MKDVCVSAQGVTHRGNVREENQDQYLIAELAPSAKVLGNSVGLNNHSRLFSPPTSYLFVVADGMGGHLGGREASTRAIQFFLSAILHSPSFRLQPSPKEPLAFTDILRTMLVGAHRELVRFALSDPDLKGMGTTLTAAYIVWPTMFVVHAGDTRCYLKRDEELILLTRDHTVAQQMIRAGRMDAAAQERSPWSNVLVNALGAGAEEVFADITTVDLQFGDRLLMCSDGINKHATDEQIKQMLIASSPLEDCANRLVEFALSDGGTDNITVLLSDFASTDSNEVRVLGGIPSGEKVVIEFPEPYTDSDTNDADTAADEKKTATFELDTPSEDEKSTGDFLNESVPH